MKKAIFILVMAVCLLHYAAAEAPEYKKVSSVSFDPLTFTGFLFAPSEIDFRNVWLAADINWETAAQKEMGMGVFLRWDRVALSGKYRSFYDKERQSGFFWGLFGLVEWRMMHWYYDNSELGINWAFPSAGHDNTYHSIGITGGADIGYRFRTGNFGITSYAGLGIPLFYTFGDLPPKNVIPEFYLMNGVLRAIRIGLMLDFFQ